MDINRFLGREEIIQERVQALSISRRSDRPVTTQILLWIIIVFISVAVSSSHFWIYQVGSNNDEPRYLILARSLVYADQYGMINFPGEPLPERYPFGYPLLISSFVWLFYDQIDLPKILSLLATVLNITLLFWGWRWFCQSRSYWWGVAITGLYAVSPVTIEYSRRLMSEPVFMLFCLITILFVEKFIRGRPNPWLTSGMSAALTSVVFTRTIGVVLLIGVFIYLLAKKGLVAWKTIFTIILQMGILVSLIVAVTPVKPRDLLPLVYLNSDESARPLVAFFSGNTTSSTEDTDLAIGSGSQPSTTGWMQKSSTFRYFLTLGIRQHLGSDLRAITVPYGEGIVSEIIDRTIGNSSLWMSIFGYIVSGLVILGFFRLILREGLSLFVFFAILYFCALSLWIWNNPRLLYPIQPQIQLAWLIAIETIFLFIFRVFTRKISSNHLLQIAIASLIGLMIIASIVKNFRVQDSRIHTGDLRTRSEWVRTHSNVSDVIMTEEPEIDYLYSDRKTILFPDDLSTAEEVQEYLMKNQVNYILAAPNVRWYTIYTPIHSDLANHLMPLFEELKSQDKIRLVYSSDTDQIRIYQVYSLEGTARE